MSMINVLFGVSVFNYFDNYIFQTWTYVWFFPRLVAGSRFSQNNRIFQILIFFAEKFWNLFQPHLFISIFLGLFAVLRIWWKMGSMWTPIMVSTSLESQETSLWASVETWNQINKKCSIQRPYCLNENTKFQRVKHVYQAIQIPIRCFAFRSKLTLTPSIFL